MQQRNQLELQIAAIERDCPAPQAEARPAVLQPEGLGQEPFGRWLLAQKDRGDWIDRLADAARADRGFPKSGTVADVASRMQALGADGDAFEQLEDAERCWRSL